jgi:cobalt-zinc-cadmium efflux system membrane fusion protein
MFLFFLLISIAFFEFQCSKTPEKENIRNEISSQKSESVQEETLSKKRGPDGKGFGRRTGRNYQRAWEISDHVELSDAEKQVVEIETAKVTTKGLRSQLEAMGKILAHQSRKAIVCYAFSARIGQIHVTIGDWVKAGQPLVTLQSEEVGEAKSAFYKAKADFELARSNYDREKKLFDRGVGAQKNFLATEAGFKVAQANLDAAEKKLHVLGFSEEQVKGIAETHQINPVITLFAPISGKIVQNNAVLGAMVDQSSEIMTILDPRLLWVDAEIYEKDIAKIRIGQNVEVSVPAYPGETFVGKICYVSDILKEDTRTITVRTEVENMGYKLKPGMFATIKIFLNHLSDSLVVPETAVLDDKNEKIVFIKRDGKFFPQAVLTGIKEKGFIEILSGLSEGDDIVTKGSYQLKSKLYDEILKKAGIH